MRSKSRPGDGWSHHDLSDGFWCLDRCFLGACEHCRADHMNTSVPCTKPVPLHRADRSQPRPSDPAALRAGGRNHFSHRGRLLPGGFKGFETGGTRKPHKTSVQVLLSGSVTEMGLAAAPKPPAAEADPESQRRAQPREQSEVSSQQKHVLQATQSLDRTFHKP